MGLLVKEVSKSFGDKKAVENISFEITKPGVFGLLGTNGAGKTTTIRMLLGIIMKDKGEITWNGKKVDRKHVNFGYMPEERGVYPKSKIYDQLMYFGELKGMTKKQADTAIRKWMKQLHMEEYLNMTAEKLSKGNQQKIQFIIAVMNDPELIILDEPFSGLDPVNSEQLKKVVLDLVKAGKYIVMSSHQMTQIEEFCSDILILDHGKTVLNGNLQEIKETYPARELEVITEVAIEKEIQQIGLTIQKQVNYQYCLKIQNEEEATKLYQVLANAGVKVIKFEIKKPSLEEIFIEKVKGAEK